MTKPKGVITQLDGKGYYKIENYESMEPFFINVSSASDVWIFISSNGGITAGRRNADRALFPYETDDKLHSQKDTGSRTIIYTDNNYWEPFERTTIRKWNVTRNIYKSLHGDSLVFEEINNDLELKFSYSLSTSEKYGMIKTGKIENISQNPMDIEILDGLQNIMPYGVNKDLQANSSTLVDAYKANEFGENKLAIYSITTLINDSPSAVEVLRANVAWSTCNDADVSLDSNVVLQFYNKNNIDWEQPVYGKKGGYFVHRNFKLQSGKSNEHSIILDSGYSHSEIVNLEKLLVSSDSYDWLFEDVEKNSRQLVSLVEKADGIQSGGDTIACNHHYMNTLYNIMRGGIFEKGYEFDYDDFYDFVLTRNKKLTSDKQLWNEIKNAKTIHQLKEVVKRIPHMERLVLEYMPLSFSRRHGDPSRPWNVFNINLKDDNNKRILEYEGNWRDIFQNWEALGLSFPSYYENMVAKFVNATTIDGFNPYRINRNGIDWEKPEKDNPFGSYGYWSDHQIIYLLRLLYGLEKHFPNRLTTMLSESIFSYANVPYKLSDYNELLKDSKNTITFDFKRDKLIEKLSEEIGTDGRLVQHNGNVYMVNLMEKLFVPLMSKISNLLLGGGIWMNTQRPEWNDANNTIVGIGLSVVTVYHLYAYIVFMEKLMPNASEKYSFSEEVGNWLIESTKILDRVIKEENDNGKEILYSMGNCFSDYRKQVYENGFSGKLIEINKNDLSKYLKNCLYIVEKTIENNKDNIYTSYNLLNEDFSYKAMRPMLEGQSAVIGSGILDENKTCELIKEIEPVLYSQHLKAHYLYPIKKTKAFMERNIIKENITHDDKIITKDINGNLHFASNITTEEALTNALKNSDYSADEKEAIYNSFENTFGHSNFTGRSEVMYKFEGIGCVYWHQNAKLTLAVLETAINSRNSRKDSEEIYDVYQKLVNGFIYRKSPEACGAFPLEPYSHTSFNNKSEQPGMTGQVKESLLMRRGELGVLIRNGKIIFDPWFIQPSEFDEKGNINFTICGVPIMYSKNGMKGIEISLYEGEKYKSEITEVPVDMSRSIFMGENKIKKIIVSV